MKAKAAGRSWCGVALTTCVFTQVLHFVDAQQPSALSVPIDGSRWIGYDGTWSPVTLRVGTPVQAIDLLPNTAGQEILVVGTEGCDGTTQCQLARGGTFASNQSSTFDALGDYTIGLDVNLGLTGGGYYGFDTIEIGSEDEKLKKQIVGIVNSTQYWIGSLGLGTANTTIGTTQTTSLLETLAGASPPLIPSLSYGLTVGAHYQLKQVPCSLTLGGYDASRLSPSNVSFALNDNQKPTLALNSFSMDGFGSGGNVSLIGEGDQALYTIDSTDPFLWLPSNVATQLGDQLGLMYNDTLGVFLYPNESQYLMVSSSSLSFNFGFADLPGSSMSLSLGLSGQALTSLNLTYGFPGLHISSDDPPIPYFPVRKAANSSQYTLGRALLQEMYLIVDYERNNFSLSQAQFTANAAITSQIVNILPPKDGTSGVDTDNSASTHPSQSLSTGAIAGIAIAVVVVLVIAICGVAICLIRKHYNKKATAITPTKPQVESRHGISRVIFGDYKILELPAREHCPSPPMAMGKPVDSPAIAGHYHKERSKVKHLHVSISGTARELSGSNHMASELPGDLQSSSRGGALARVELPTRRTGLSEIAMLAGTLTSTRHEQPSPPSSVADAYPTISTLDTISDWRSPHSPLISDGFGSSDASRQSIVSRGVVSHSTTQPNSNSHSRTGSRGGKSVTGSGSRNDSRKGSVGAPLRSPGGHVVELAVRDATTRNNSWNRARSLVQSDDGDSFTNMIPPSNRDMVPASDHSLLHPTVAAEGGGPRSVRPSGNNHSRDDPPPSYGAAVGPVELPVHPNTRGRPRLNWDHVQQDGKWH